MRSGIVVVWMMLIGASAAHAHCDAGALRSQAIQEIEHLRRAYARATDAIGSDTAAQVEAGRETYRRIFTADVAIRASGIDGLTTGPDAWVEVVRDALGPMQATQHFIGTQTVDIDALEFDADCRLQHGSARMDSYLQAWHTRADGSVWLFVGNYADEVLYTPGAGWQIATMALQRIAEEVR